MTRRTNPTRMVALVILALTLSSGTVLAHQKEAFTPERFAALQTKGAVILLHVYSTSNIWRLRT